ncbi:AGAP013425-PA-like protein [Anopheles sinensis]|uniref:AGAP013425-PA-like protein n=1 Tax=Anopheles sinensis TaxID=74873 RepID=A0A084VEH4_ANOSI|nr:AGAP013425-PA-like protein [Anopheles sinensis]
MTPQCLVSLSVLIFTFSTTNSSLSPPRSIDCQSNAVLMETTILENYLTDQHTLAVIDSCTEIPIVSPNCLRTPIKLHAFTLHRFQRFVEETYEQNTQQLDYRTNECFVGAGHIEQLGEELVPFLAHYNPRAKVMLITQHASGEQLAELFHIAWYRYRLLQLVVLNHHENDTMESCVFNPFHKRTSLSVWPPDTLPSDLECRLLAGVKEVMSYNVDLARFTHERVRNLHGYPLKIAMHSSNGSTSAYDCILGAVTFTDIDQEILSIMQSMLNFSMILHNDELELSIGYIHPNGTPVGTLGLIENNLVDLAANSRIIHNYDTRNLLYLHYITTEKLVFITPRNYYRNRDITLVFINPFSVAYMLTNVLLSFGVPLVIYLLERVAHRLPVPGNTRQQSFGTKVLNTVGIIYNVSVRLPRSARKRWIIVGILVYNIVSYPIWQGVTIRYLQPSNEQVNNINSLEQLIETDLTLKVSQYHEHIVRHEGPHQQNPVYRELTGRLNTKNTSSLRGSIEKIIIDRDTALLISDVYVPLVLAGNYKWIPGKPDAIWSIGKPIYEFYKSMAVPKTSPFVQTLNSIVLACVEAGLNDRFMHQLETVVQLMKIRRLKEHPAKPNYIVFNMEHLMPLFVFYFAMMALACVVFLLEIVVWRITKARAHRVIPAPVDDYVPFEFVL